MENNKKLVIAISSRALFDLDESHRIFDEQGPEAFHKYHVQRENETLQPGVAFSLVKKLLALNHQPQNKTTIEVILLSRNSAEVGIRIFNSIRDHELDISRAAFTSGRSPFRYIKAFGAHLFLSAHAEDVKMALEGGHAAATVITSRRVNTDSDEIRFAFDGDAVLFSDESERIYREQGLAAFSANETQRSQTPLGVGPFKPFLEALHEIQQHYPVGQSPIRIALVTARCAPAHERVIRTLREWDILVDEALFLGGLPKAQFLKAFGADIFFDDQARHCALASEHVATGHVPFGVANGT